MKEKAFTFAIIAFFVVCLVLFLPVIAMRFSQDGLDWLASEPAISGYMGYDEDHDDGGDDGNGDTPPPPPGQVDPGQPKMARDPNTPDISIWFPPGSVSVPVEVRTYHTGFPPGVPPPSGGIGAPFFFGAWIRGEGTTLNEFNTPIVINAPYGNSGVSQAPHSFQPLAKTVSVGPGLLAGWPLAMVAHPALTIFSPQESALSRHSLIPPTQEQQLRLNMYNPATQSWVKLCSSVNIYTKRVSGVLAAPTPIDTGGNTLLAIAVDDTPPLNQVVDDQGKTTLSIEGVNTRLQVLPGTVEQGVHFEITLQPDIPDSVPVKLLAKPIDIKACQIDHIVNENSTQITQFPKPLGVEFDYETDTLASAGGKANLTTAILQNGQWVDMEEFGYQVIRDEGQIKVDTDRLGTFSMAAR